MYFLKCAVTMINLFFIVLFMWYVKTSKRKDSQNWIFIFLSLLMSVNTFFVWI